MRNLLLIMGSLALSTAAMADTAASCQAAATAQKLAGQARTAFVKQCEAEAKAKMSLVQQQPRRMSMAPTNEFGHCSHSEKDL